MLFVPGDSERKFDRGATSGADALILDLEDSVAPSQKNIAREHVSVLLEAHNPRPWAFFVRVNPLDTNMTEVDLAAVVMPGLDGILLPKANGNEDVVAVAAILDRLEAARGMEHGSIGVAVVATETPRAMLNLGSYATPHPRLVAMTWGAEDLAAAIGATSNKEEDGGWTNPYIQARTMCLFAASAAQVIPLDTLYADYRDISGLEADCRRSRRDGFTGRIAIHPDQIPAINACYSPSESEIRDARKIVDAFSAEPSAGTIGIDGTMYDIPHLKAAIKTLSAANL